MFHKSWDNNSSFFSLFKNFSSYIVVQPINSVVTVSGAQKSNSTIHIHVSILPETPLPSRPTYNVEQSSVCYRVDSYWLSILNTAVMDRHEIWIIKKVESQRTVAFELWCWRRLMRIPWTARSNQSIVKEINPEYSLERLMLKLKLQYVGHLR